MPYPSSPTNPPKYVIRFECEGRLLISTWTKPIAPLKQLQYLGAVQKTLNTAVADDITITSHQLSEIMEYKPAETWSLSDLEIKALDHLAGKVAPRTDTTPTTPEPKPRTEPGLVTLQSICADIGMEPKEARQLLRSINYPKPFGHWSFPPSEVDAVTKALSKKS